MSKIKITVIFGEEAVSKFDKSGKKPSEKWLLFNGGVVDTVTFNTEAEHNAYIQGVNDADGWGDHYFTNIRKVIGCKHCDKWRVFFHRRKKFYCPHCGELVIQNNSNHETK